jgi:hypothetical protein
MSTYSYEYTYMHHIPMDIFKRLSRLDLEIHKVDQQKYLAIDGASSSTEKIISCKVDVVSYKE